MIELREPKTQFVRDRIKETRFSERAFIASLLDIEDNIMRYPDYPRGSPSMWQLYFHYQIERDAIRTEMLTGKITTTQEYRELERKQALEEQKQKAADKLRADKKAKQELEQWIRIGGLPDNPAA